MAERTSALIDDVHDQEVETSTSPKPPPDGGFKAWLQVVGSFFLFFNSWGIINTFGVFQTFYQTTLLRTTSPSNISWLGSIQAFLLLLVGVISGPLYDAGHFRYLIMAGSSLLLLGNLTTSFGSQYWHFVLSQALCTGVGAGFLYVPAIAILPQYFSSHKALATAIATSGSSLGGVVYPTIFQQLQPRIGFPWATRVIALVSLCTCGFSVLVMRLRDMPEQRRLLLDLSAFREPPYTLFCSAMFLAYIGFFIPIFYVQPYALAIVAAMPLSIALQLVSILNAASIPGRIIPGLLARRFRPLTLLLLSASTSAVLSLCWIAIRDEAGIIAFAALYGFSSGGFIALPAVVLTQLTPDASKLGTRMGMCSALCSLGSLCGTPIAGAILGTTSGYLGLQVFAGIVTVATGLLLMLTKLAAGEFLKRPLALSEPS